MRPNLFSSIRHGSAIDLISSKWSICETPLSTQTSKRIGFGTAHLESNLQYSPFVTHPTASFSFSKRRHYQFRRSFSGLTTLGCKMDGWILQAQAQKIFESVLFARLHILFNDFTRHGSSEQIHSDNVSCILLDKILSRTSKVYHHAFDLTRDIASTPARPAAIEGAANTFPSIIKPYPILWLIS